MDGNEKKTPLYDAHVKLGAKVVNFHDFLMPLQYDSIINEHKNVRINAGIFDISHMGKISIEGEGAAELIQWVIANDIKQLQDNGVLYTPLCNNNGGIIDDILVYKYNSGKYMLIVNCANIEKDFKWFEKFETHDTYINDLSEELALLAVQGPKSEEIIQKVFGRNCASLSHFQFTEVKTGKMELTVSRTGYTGEDGFEIIVDWDQCEELWNVLLESGRDIGLSPAGLGARDTLRLEAGYLLYGNDIDESITPHEANIGWTVKFDKPDFIAKDTLFSQKKHGLGKNLVIFKMLDKSIPRANNVIISDGNIIGRVTSGAFSPTLGIGIGLGLIEINYSRRSNKIDINIRETSHPAIIVNTPFISQSKKGT